jgi:pimeloyl-ACP methyl ester carboxylesterase
MVDRTDHVAEVDGLRIAWIEAGVGAGSPVVLVHGLGASHDWWRPTIAALAGRHRVLAVDLPGFGRSHGQPFRLDTAADVLAGWARQIGLDRAAFAGHSMGGLVCADLAARYPDLVERLVLVNAAGLALPQRVTRHLVNVARGGRHLPARVYPIALGCVLQAGPLTIAKASHQILATDLGERFRLITAPTLVVWGANDRLLPISFGRRLAAAIPGARFHRIEDAGHSPMWEQPAEFERTVEAFLTAAPERPAAATPAMPPAFDDPLRPTGGRVVSRYLPVRGWSIHARVGRPEGALDTPPIVFVHGPVIASRSHLPTMRRLARRHLVFAPDLPGFGWSSKPEGVLDVPGLADALIAAMDAAGIGRALLVGSSLGGQVAAQAAADHPDRVLGLVLAGPAFDPAERSPARQAGRFIADIPREWPSLWFEHLPATILAGAPRALRTLRHAWNHRIEAVLPDVRVPTVVVRGSDDPLVPRQWARSAATLAPIGRALEIAGGGHAVTYGTPRALARIVEDLAATVAAGGRSASDGAMPMHIVTATHRRRPVARPRRARAGPPRS